MPPCNCLTCTQSLANTLPSSAFPPGTTDADRWASFGQTDPDEDPSTPDEVFALRAFVEAYRAAETSTPSSPSAAETARRLMSLSEDRVPCDGEYDKGYRVAWLLWRAGLEMPHHQGAILEVVDAVGAMPGLEATREQVGRFGPGKMEKWRSQQYITMLNTNVHALVPYFDIAGDIIYEWTNQKTRIHKFRPDEYAKGSKEYLRSKCACLKSAHPEADLWKGDEWVTRARWAFWRERLVWVSEQTELMQRTRDEATMLVQMMKNIETGSGQSAP